MYQGMGNKLAVQYGGSNLAHTFSTYRDRNLVSKSRDLFTTITRFYSNTFSDKQKQDAIDLYLGNYVPSDPQKRTSNVDWDMESDQVLQMRKRSANDGILLLNTKWWLRPLRSFYSRTKVSPQFPFAVDHRYNPKTEKPNFFANEYFEALHNPKSITFFDKRLNYRWEIPSIPSITRGFFFETSRTTPLPTFQAPHKAEREGSAEKFDPLQAFEKETGREMPVEADEEDDEEDDKESETVLSKGVKKWFNFHYSSSKQKGEERDGNVPRGPQLMDPNFKPSYETTCDVYARDQYGIRIKSGISKRNMELYSNYATKWSDLDNNDKAHDLIKGNIAQETIGEYGESIEKSKMLNLVSKDSLSTTYQEITNHSRTYIENARKLVSGKGCVPRESEVIYVKYCKELVRLRGERGGQGRAANRALDGLGPRPNHKLDGIFNKDLPK